MRKRTKEAEKALTSQDAARIQHESSLS